MPNKFPIVVEETFKSVVVHLEYMGYSYFLEGNNSARTKHPSHCSIAIRKTQGGVLLSAILKSGIPALSDRQGFQSFINWMNSKMLVARAYADDDSDLVFEAFWPAVYDRQVFGEFMEYWWHDTDSVLNEGQVMAMHYLLTN